MDILLTDLEENWHEKYPKNEFNSPLEKENDRMAKIMLAFASLGLSICLASLHFDNVVKTKGLQDGDEDFEMRKSLIRAALHEFLIYSEPGLCLRIQIAPFEPMHDKSSLYIPNTKFLQIPPYSLAVFNKLKQNRPNEVFEILLPRALG
ncbi:hypothetical protein HK100_006952, partial [Physocladia obscura]